MTKLVALLFASLMLLGGTPVHAKGDAEQGRAEVRQVTQTVLADFYKVQPSARKAVESSAGYAVY